MSHFKLSLIGLATGTLMIAALVPGGSAAAKADRDTVSGDGSSAVANFRFDGFNQGTTPDTPSGGAYHADNPAVGIDFNGPITCLHVEGNRAGFLYPIEDGSKPEAAVGQTVLISIEDNGTRGDKIGFVGPGPVDQLLDGCAPGPTPFKVAEGGVTVHDAP